MPDKFIELLAATQVTFVRLLGLMFTVFYAARFTSALRYAEILQAYTSALLPAYIAGTGLLWAALFGWQTWQHYRQEKVDNRFMKIVLLWVAWFWADRLLLQHHQPPGGNNWLFWLIFQALLLGISIPGRLMYPERREQKK